MMCSRDLALRKGKKFKQEEEEEEVVEDNIDFLSNLPEDLTRQILSFLSTKDAVRTSVLSKCWEKRWTNITNLSFDDQLLYGGEINNKENFMSFVDQVLLLLHNPVIESFTLRCTDHYVASRVYAWIYNALSRHVQKLIISCPVEGFLVFPRFFYDTTSLIEMDLEMKCFLNVATNVCFSSLKILHLSEVCFLSDDLSISNELNLSFPKLYELKLHRCKWLGQKLINIVAPELKSFTIADDEGDYRLVEMITYCEVKIYARNLCKFICGSYLIVHITLVDPSSVVDATIELYSNQWELMMAMLACNLLQQLCGVKHLTLSRRTILVLCRQNKLDDNMVTFNFPLHLTITWGIPSLVHLVELFRVLPGLISLTFSKGNPYVPLGYLPRCSLPNLKVLKILSCFPSELAKFILVNATELEEMIITCNQNTHMDSERLEQIVQEDLQSVQWASCRVSIKIIHKARREC